MRVDKRHKNMMDEVIGKYGFENQFVIYFCGLIETAIKHNIINDEYTQAEINRFYTAMMEA